MKQLLLLGVFVVLAACKGGQVDKVVATQSPDGHRFHFMQMAPDGDQDVAIMIAWPTARAYETGSNPAVAYVAAETILSGGTDELAPQEVLELFNDQNTRGHLFVRPDHLIGQLVFSKDHLDDVVPIAARMLAEPQFDPAWVMRVKQEVAAQVAQSWQRSADQMWGAARLAVLGAGPLNDFLGLYDRSQVDQVEVADLRLWHKQTLVRRGAHIVVTGAITPSQAGKAVDRLLGGLPDHQAVPAPTITTDFSPRTILLHLPDAPKTTLGFLGPLPPTSDGGDLTDLLGIHVFGRADGGPLFDVVRTELRASYGFQVGFTNYDRATRVMFITGEVETTKLALAADQVRAAYGRFLTDTEFDGFDDLRGHMTQATARNMSMVDVAARTMLELLLDQRDPAEALGLADQIASISKQDLSARLRDGFPAAKDLIVIAVSPDASALPGACVITQVEQAARCP